jgi:hypothetical protein
MAFHRTTFCSPSLQSYLVERAKQTGEKVRRKKERKKGRKKDR